MVIQSPGPTTHLTLTSTPASASTMSAYDLDVKNAITLFQTTITFPSNAEACANDRFIGLVCLLSFLSSFLFLFFLWFASHLWLLMTLIGLINVLQYGLLPKIWYSTLSQVTHISLIHCSP